VNPKASAIRSTIQDRKQKQYDARLRKLKQEKELAAGVKSESTPSQVGLEYVLKTSPSPSPSPSPSLKKKERKPPPTPSFALGDFPTWFRRIMSFWPNKSDPQLAQQFLAAQDWLTDKGRVRQFEVDVKVWGSCEKNRWKNGQTCPKLYQFVKDYELGYRGQKPAKEVDPLEERMRGI
jgi:hypothetical protein